MVSAQVSLHSIMSELKKHPLSSHPAHLVAYIVLDFLQLWLFMVNTERQRWRLDHGRCVSRV